MSISSIYSANAYHSPATLWKPRSQRVVVGRDIGRMTATSFESQQKNIVIGDADDVIRKSQNIFSLAKENASQGFYTKSFRGLSASLGTIPENIFAERALMENEKYTVSAVNGRLRIFEKQDDDHYKEIRNQQITDDIIVRWGEDGTPQVLMGDEVTANGKLTAKGSKELIIRVSDKDVVLGNDSTVLNLSSKGGNFIGGTNATFLGVYQKATFTGIEGKIEFAGYFSEGNIAVKHGEGVFSGVFENMELSGSDTKNVFSGYFAASTVTGGNGDNCFSGLFLSNSKVTGGDDDDSFTGRFIYSKVSGGKGNDRFGNGGNLDMMGVLYSEANLKLYHGLEADFLFSEVTGDDGDDEFKGVMINGTLELGAGNDKANGVFVDATVSGGAGDDTMSAWYAQSSTFSANEGNNAISMQAGISSQIISGEGQNSIVMGANKVESTDKYAASSVHANVTWQTVSDFFAEFRPVDAGELVNSHVDLRKGENTTTIRDGKAEHTIVQRNALDSTSDTPSTQNPVAAQTATAQHTDTTKALLVDKEQKKRSDDAAIEQKVSEQRSRYGQKQYALVISGERQNTGLMAASVTLAHGENFTIDGIERKKAPEPIGNNDSMVRTMRMWTADGRSTGKHSRIV